MNRKESQKVKLPSTKPIRYYMTTYLTVSMLVLLQMIFLVVSALALSKAITWIDIACRAISIIVVVIVINRKVSPSYQLSWCVPILVFPVLGGLAYLISRGRQNHKALLRKISQNHTAIREAVPDLQKTEPPADCRRLAEYLNGYQFIGYRNTRVQYFPSGESMYESMMEDLRNAKESIYMEFFIVRVGEMWSSILEILREKAAAGVDVRLMYDGMGSVKCLPRGYHKKLNAMGIKTRVFRPYIPVITTVQNNRDHRKIVLVDHRIGYTGGINISDEYINRYERCGNWKDSGIRLMGDAVQGLVRIFLENWYLTAPRDEDLAEQLRLHPYPTVGDSHSDSGYVIPYADAPVSEQNVGKNVYLEVISGAKEYLYIMTPYFIPGEEILGAICRSARSGVDVRILTPNIGDKRLIHTITRSYYNDLLAAGVRVYEYQPGFVHSKLMVSDDRIATVGTMNLDYRSLYLHFECGCAVSHRETAVTIRDDFLSTLESCTEMTPESCRRSAPVRLLLSLLRVFEPLL